MKNASLRPVLQLKKETISRLDGTSNQATNDKQRPESVTTATTIFTVF